MTVIHHIKIIKLKKKAKKVEKENLQNPEVDLEKEIEKKTQNINHTKKTKKKQERAVKEVDQLENLGEADRPQENLDLFYLTIPKTIKKIILKKEEKLEENQDLIQP